jgi:hypothetical protein
LRERWIVTRDDARAFIVFVLAAERKDVSWELGRQAGWYVDGQNTIGADGRILDVDEIPEEHRIPLERGYQIMVAQQGYVDDDGNDILYPTISDALVAGLRIIDGDD